VLAVGDELLVDGMDLIGVLPGHVVEEQDFRGAVAGVDDAALSVSAGTPMWMPRTVSMPANVRNPASSLARSSLEFGFFSQKTWCTTGGNDVLLAEMEAVAREPVAVRPAAKAVAATMTSRRERSGMIGVLSS
jgi:hypothetical protein